MEAYKLWCLKYLTCPICTAKRDNMNQMNGKQVRKRNQFDIQSRINIFNNKNTFTAQIAYSTDLKTKTDHLPIKCGFTDFSEVNPYDNYIPDLLHQPKKGIFANLLTALEKYLDHHGLLEEIESRMQLLPRFTCAVEHFNTSWFQMQTVTASNYMVMVTNLDVRFNVYLADIRNCLDSPDCSSCARS
jgi:hypothetical protein